MLKHAFFAAGGCQKAFGRSTQLIARNLELQALDKKGWYIPVSKANIRCNCVLFCESKLTLAWSLVVKLVTILAKLENTQCHSETEIITTYKPPVL